MIVTKVKVFNTCTTGFMVETVSLTTILFDYEMTWLYLNICFFNVFFFIAEIKAESRFATKSLVTVYDILMIKHFSKITFG